MSRIIENLNWRYACKQFDQQKKISDDDFNILLEALRLSASSFGLQPWKFVVVENPQIREKLLDASWKQRQVVEASHLIVMCAPRLIDQAFVERYVKSMAMTRNQKVEDLSGLQKMLMMIPNKSAEDQKVWANNQIYIALGSLLAVCADLKIDSCPMEGFMPKKYDEILSLEKVGLRSVLVMPVGYRASDDKYAELEKVRYPLDELVLKV